MIIQITPKAVVPDWFDLGSILNETEWYEESIGTKVIMRRTYNDYTRVIGGAKERFRWITDCEVYPR